MRPLKMLVLVSALLSLCTLEAATNKPMFSGGTETFKIQNEKGRTPEFRVLDDDATEKALAYAAIAYINSHEEVTPKVPVRDYVDLKVETLRLTPNGKTELDVFLKLSGYELELDRTINRQKLLSGETIDVVYSPKSKDVAIFTIQSSGSLRMRFDKATNSLLLQKVHAKMNYESQFGGEGQEEIRFSGKGIRQ